MKYISIERPSPYDNVISFDIFEYNDELTLDRQIFSIDVIKEIPLEQFKDKVKASYRVMTYNLRLEKEDIDFNELKKLINQECFEIEDINFYISVTI